MLIADNNNLYCNNELVYFHKQTQTQIKNNTTNPKGFFSMCFYRTNMEL